MAYMPTSSTILAHQAWRAHTHVESLKGTGHQKVHQGGAFVFESEGTKTARRRPALADYNTARGRQQQEAHPEAHRPAVRWPGSSSARSASPSPSTPSAGFMCADDLRRILESVVELKDFLESLVVVAH
uniref:DUF7851 domain-containing protein n=1 Tax=Oryza meridionalis TaxID=40149 RepID=A0A0E0DAW2_9ORYZ